MESIDDMTSSNHQTREVLTVQFAINLFGCKYGNIVSGNITQIKAESDHFAGEDFYGTEWHRYYKY